MVIFKNNINFKLAKIGIVQKIRENDFVQNLVTFFSLALRSNEDCGQTIHRTHLKRVSKQTAILENMVIFLFIHTNN